MSKSWIKVGLPLLACTAACSAAEAAGAILSIEAQPIERAIRAWAEQTGYQVLIRSDAAASSTSAPVGPGEYQPEVALKLLLSNANLEYRFINGRTVLIQDAGSGRSAGKPVRVAQAAQSPTQPPAGNTGGSDTGRTGVEPPKYSEVIVTAQKRDERLRDVPVPVAAIDAETLADNNQLRLKDYYTKVPGLNLTTGVRGDTQLSIRGLSSGVGTIPTVGVTVDDVPYGSSVALTGGFSTPDIDPSDLARVEVLRGPQGTLYGANSIGGLLKFVTVDPSTERMSAVLSGGLSNIHNGDNAGYNARAAFNIPLSDSIAIRASGFSRRVPGYIENIVSGNEGANETEVDGGRVSALWKASDDVSLKLSALMQDNRVLGSQLVNVGPGLGDLQQNAPRNTGWLERKMEAYSAVFKAGLGSAELTSVTGYNVSDQSLSAQVGANALFERLKTNKFTQELRLTTPLGESLEFLVGAFYTEEKTRGVQDTESLNAATGVPVRTLRYDDFPATYEEYAAFADLTFQFSEQFDVQVGGRATENRQTYSRVSSGPNAPVPAILPERRLKDSSFTYLVTPRFKTDDLMFYARFASGYRPGSLNSGIASLPLTYEADTTLNYELGMKGDLFNAMLSFDISVYYIDWKDIQILVIPPPPAPGNYFDNVGRARSQGAELSFELRPLSQMTITGWTAYTDATLKENLPPGPALGRAGDNLPFSARWSGNLAVDQGFPLWANVAGFVGVSMSYVGERDGSFVAGNLQRQNFPSYTQLDINAGAEFDTWKVTLYGTNIADKRGAITGNPTIVPSGVLYIQPRTIGVSVTKTF